LKPTTGTAGNSAGPLKDTTMSDTITASRFAHVTARHARRLLVAGDRPSHELLDLAYQEAVAAVTADEDNPSINWEVIDRRWKATTNLSAGCTLYQRMDALREFWRA
jgi:hypothetical protein